MHRAAAQHRGSVWTAPVSDRNTPGSRWSSARDREERDRRRKAEREEAKRARQAREASDEAALPPDSGGKRRLTDEERRTIREYRFPSMADRDKDSVPPAKTPVAPTPAASESSDSAALPPRSATASSTKWRDSAPPLTATGGSGSGGGSLPDLPGDNGGSGGPRRPGNSRLLVFGVGLFALMALIYFLPFGPFADQGEKPLPTPSQPLPSIFETPDAGDGDATETANQPEAEIGQAIVCIDAGHGGWDTGWDRTDQGDSPYGPPIVTEAEINLGMAYMLKEILESEGIFVVMTRPSGAAVNIFDEDVNGDGETRLDAENTEQAGDRDELQARINACNEAGADILISMHVNGFDDRSVNGYEIIYTREREFGEQNEELANLIYRQLDTALRDTDMGGKGRGADPDSDIENQRHEFGTADHFLMTGPAVEEASITPSEMPGVIAEIAFLSNDQDAAWLVQPDNQRIAVEAYARGILEYFEQNPPSS